MLFPIIRVKDKETGVIHIIGTNSHDSLEIDNEAGILRYYNLQNGCGTGSLCSYEFNHQPQTQEEIEYGITPTIEFVTLEKLMEIYKEDKKPSLDFSKYPNLKGKDRGPDDDDDF